jgi:hypothetical protein
MGQILYNRSLQQLKQKSVFLLFLLTLFFTAETHGQAREFEAVKQSRKKPERSAKFDASRLRYGGSFGATFGDITFVEISPTVGYLLTDQFMLGLGGRYMYFEERFRFTRYTTNIYGANIFAQYFFMENFIAHTEFEVLNLDDRFIPDERVNVNSFFVGGGYRSMISDRSFASILVLFNLTEDANTPYTNPVVRVNFGFGI